MRNWLVALSLIAALAVVTPDGILRAQSPEEQDPVEEFAREGLETMMRMLGTIVDNIPQYEMPEVNENGDIIIRRKRNKDSEPDEAPILDEDSAET